MSFAELSRAPRGRAGFTMVELMVAVVIMGILTTALWQLVRSQSSFVAFEQQREDATDNARATVDILTGDLRGVLPRGLIEAQSQSLVMALPRAWGVTCATSTANQLDAVFPAMPSDAFTISSGSGFGLVANTSASSTPVWSPRPTTDNTRGKVTGAATLNVGTSCASASGTGLVAYRFSGSNFPVVSAGTVVMLYQLVKYDVGTSDGRQWVRRSTGLTDAGSWTMTPLAGPLKDATSLVFTYYTGSTATVQNPAPGLNTALLDDVSRVKIGVTTASSGSYNGNSTQQTASTTVLLRNRAQALQCGVAAYNPPAPC